MKGKAILLLLLLLPFVSAEANQIGVLTVGLENREGGVADVYLDIRPGAGRMFVDSYPLTQVDTQVSARFAREYACDLASIDCSKLDFFYVIRAPSSIVSGPSAGGAMTVLTYATLLDLELEENMVMTGTINSGGLVGPVGGVDQKVLAAELMGYDTVLVPPDSLNDSLNTSRNITVIPIHDIEDAIYYFTGKDVRYRSTEILVPNSYLETMKEVQEALCKRADDLSQIAGGHTNLSARFVERAANATEENKMYSAASFCFSANLELREHLLEDRTQDELTAISRSLLIDIDQLDKELPTSFATIPDLEVYMIVRERYVDAYNRIESQNWSNISHSDVAYATERMYSAVSWSVFFGRIPGEQLQLSDTQLEDACFAKLSEAEERIHFVEYSLGISLDASGDVILQAEDYARQEEYPLCIFGASRAKAEADSVISALLSPSQFNASVDRKLRKAAQLLSERSQAGTFPILGYSYYEYARDLEYDIISQSLYGEYAMELSSLDIYFDSSHKRLYIDWNKVLLLVTGIVLGFLLGALTWELFRVKHSKKSKKKT